MLATIIQSTGLTAIFNIIYVCTVVFVAILVIQQKSNPIKTISWILVISFLPIVGIILYFYFGKNYRKEKMFSRKGLSDLEYLKEICEEQLEKGRTKNFENEKINEKKPIMKLILNSEKSILTEHNKVEFLVDGKATFKAMIKAMEEAQHFIHLESYIIENGHVGELVRRTLIKKAKEGVQVRVIFDDLGSWKLSNSYIASLKEAGVKIYAFLPVRFMHLANKINYRNHRKILIVDGKFGFVGGLNIADRYLGGDKELGLWRDTHLLVEGDAVRALHTVFLTDWYFVTNEPIKKDEFFIPFRIPDYHLLQIVSSGPDSDWSSIMQAYFVAIATAKTSIFISTPYFIPNESILTALKTSALSGVNVQLILPGKSDSRLVYWSTLSYIEELLEAGIEVYFYNKGFIHSKLLVVDDVFSSIGTANMDIRSFDQNFEVNAIIYDEEITNRVKDILAHDLSFCEKVTLESWEARPKWKEVRESLARICSPLF